MEEFNIKVDPIVNKFFVISGPTKHGKTEICQRLLKYLAEPGKVSDGCIFTNNADSYKKLGYKNVSNIVDLDQVNGYVQHYKNVNELHYIVFDNSLPTTHWETNKILELCANNRKNTTIIVASENYISLGENIKNNVDYIMVNGDTDKITKDRIINVFKLPEEPAAKFKELSGFYYFVISKIPDREYMWFNNRRGIIHRFMGSYLGY